MCTIVIGVTFCGDMAIAVDYCWWCVVRQVKAGAC